jgi:outer membrane protein OmpA-like peptidoglycan-associated protein
MAQGYRWKLCTWVALLMLWLATACGSPIFAAGLEVDQLIEHLRKQIFAAEKRAREIPLFGVKEVRLHISYAIEEKGEGSFKAFVIAAGASVSAHAVQTMEITLTPVKELRVEAPSTEKSTTTLVDLRGRSDYTTEDLAGLLFAMAEPAICTRGIGPAGPGAPSVERTSLALNVLFEPGSSTISPLYYPDLDKLGEVLTSPRFQEYRSRIEGHTDNRGIDHYNHLISERRAESVKQYLVQYFSIDPRRLAMKGYGATRPLAPNDTPEGRSRNRRVEIVNLGKG